jgi:hypothetical protein
MTGFIDRARHWRRRAAHLRATADRMETPSVQSNLLDMAVACENHADNIERVVFKLDSARANTATVESFQDFYTSHQAILHRRRFAG